MCAQYIQQTNCKKKRMRSLQIKVKNFNTDDTCRFAFYILLSIYVEKKKNEIKQKYIQLDVLNLYNLSKTNEKRKNKNKEKTRFSFLI